MKKLIIFKEYDGYVMQRVNEFGELFESRHTLTGLQEVMVQYRALGKLDNYEIQATPGVKNVIK